MMDLIDHPLSPLIMAWLEAKNKVAWWYSAETVAAEIVARDLLNAALIEMTNTCTPEVLRLLRKISDLAYDEDVGEPLDCAIDYANKAIAALAAAPAVGGEPVAWRWRHVNSPSKDWNYQHQPIGSHNEYLEVDPLYVAQPASPLRGRELNENERHAVGHARYQVEHATPENPDCWFDYELVATLLSLIAAPPEQPAATLAMNAQAIADYIYEETTKLDAPISYTASLVMARHILASTADPVMGGRQS